MRMESIEKQINKFESSLDKLNALTKEFYAINLQNEKIKKDLDAQKISITKIEKSTNEILWAQIYNNTVSQSSWLQEKEFSPGRWAIGYDYLYVMYRVLNETHPERILEFGLGQSTKMISQYAKRFNNSEHIVVEQDEEWISFFKNGYVLPGNSAILYLPTKEVDFLDDTKTLIYEGLGSALQGMKFDFISVDGPGHSRSKVYRRVDLLTILPDCLDERFVILFDDINDMACRNALLLVEKRLDECSIPYCKGVYSGKKEVVLLCDQNHRFLCSL